MPGVVVTGGPGAGKTTLLAMLAAMLLKYPFHRSVFILPPWEAIYATAELRRRYRSCGYDLQEVPCLPVAPRARHVLRALAASEGGHSERVT